jgi:hypothetical protein
VPSLCPCRRRSALRDAAGHATEIERRLDKAVRDSTRLTNVLEARRKVTAERDSVMRQVQIIRTIDDNRYVWAHLLDEISTALPQYTWLTSWSRPARPPCRRAPSRRHREDRQGWRRRAADAKAAAPAGKAAAAKAAAAPQDSIVIHQPVAFRVVGQTVDMQALTQFMKDLEASPFVKNVMLMKSEIVVVDTARTSRSSRSKPSTKWRRRSCCAPKPLVVPVR